MSESYALAVLFALCGCILMQAGFHLFTSARPTVMKVMFLTHVFAQLLPAFVFAARDGGPASQDFLLWNAIATVLIPIGGLIANMLLPIGSGTPLFHAALETGIAARKPFGRFYIAYALFCFSLFVVYISIIPVIPVYELFFGVREFLIEIRREASDAGLLFGIGTRFFMPLLFLLSMIGVNYFSSGLIKWIAVAGMIVPLLYNAWPGNKTPVATIFLMAVFVLLIRRRETKRVASAALAPSPAAQRRTRRRRTLGIIVLALLALGYPAYVYMNLPVGRQGLAHVIVAVFERIFFKPAENSHAAFMMFYGGGYTYFSDISKFSSVFGLDYINLSRAVADFRGLGELTNSPPAAIGNFYAQGGAVAVVLGVVVAAMTFKASENLLGSSRPKVPLTIALYAMVLFGSFRFSWANFHTLLMSELFMPMVLVLVVWAGFRGSRAGAPHRAARAPDEGAFPLRAHHGHA